MKTILVLEDNLTELHATARVLEHAGYRVLRATSGPDALRLIETARPDLALLDHQVPGISGLEVLKQIKADPATAEVFGVIHSATRVSADEQAEGLKAGADGYLAKPMPVVEFLARIATFLRQKSLVDSVRRSEARFKSLITATVDAMLVVDLQGAIRFCNPAAEQLFGRRAAELRQVPFGQAVTDGSVEMQVLGPEDRLITVEMRAVGIDWEDQPARLITLQDISERKRAEEATRASEQRFRQMVETALEGVWSLDTESRTTFANRRLEEMLGVGPGEMLGRLATEFVVAEELESYRQHEARRRGGQAECYERRFRRRDGTVMTALVSAAPIVGSEGQYAGSFAMVTDITERKRIEEASRRSEARYRALFECATDAIFVAEAESGLLVGANPRALSLIGGSLGEVLEAPFTRLHPAEDQARAEAAFRRAAQGEKAESVRIRVQPREGRLIAVEINFARLVIQGSATLVFGVYRDISERMQAEEQLRESERLYHSLVQHLPQSIYRKDVAGRITFANPLFGELCGQPLEALLGKTDAELYPAELARKSQRDDQLVLGAGRTLETVETYRAADGREVTVQSVKTPLHNAAGEIVGLQGIVWDISERKRAEAALRASEERFRTLVENAPDAIFVQTQGQFAYLNTAALELFGAVTPTQLLGQRVTDRLPPESRPASQERARLLDEERLPLPRREERYLRLDGSIVDVEVSAVPLVYETERGALVFVRDITERKQAEERLRQALEEKEVLLREVHHRVKNNLQAIIHLTSAKEERVSDPATGGFLRDLQSQARTMSLVYEQLYQSENLARVEMQPYLEELAQNVLLSFGEGREVALRVEAAGVVMDVESAMPTGLIVNELLTNALKHAFPEPAGARELRVSLRPTRDQFHLVVADNGVGLPPGLDWRTAGSLGLRLVHLWVTHQLGGEVDLRGPPGAAFHMRFPGREGRRRVHG